MKIFLAVSLALNIALCGTLGAFSYQYNRAGDQHKATVTKLRAELASDQADLIRLGEEVNHQTEVANASTATAQWMSDYILITNDMASDDADATDIMLALASLCPNKPASVATPALCEELN